MIDDVRRLATPLRTPLDLDPLIEAVGSSRFVLLGEASHGTSDYYVWRAEITKRLISEKGFNFVAVEGDWPDCFRLNRWVKGRLDPQRSARDVLSEFDRWPTWMWANEEVADFADWLREHNRSSRGDVGFYGLDVYSLWDSLRVVFAYLSRHHPDALDDARAAVRCFEPYGEDPQAYGWATRLSPGVCEEDVVRLLARVRTRAGMLDGEPEASLDAVQNAEVVAGAESYYRTMVRADQSSWNIRDTHMADTLDRLIAHQGSDAKAVVWEHNTHIGDARGTDMASAGMVNVGQLVRERHAGDGVLLVGFGGHRGSVIAADAWGSPMRRLEVPAAHRDSHEGVLHEAIGEPSLLVFGDARSSGWLSERRGHRAIGVVYDPARDPYGNWVPTVMGLRYDAFLYLEETHALDPLHFERAQHMREQETYPWAS